MLTILQPTGGPILLHDLQPEKEKALIEEKLKKVATEKAPVAGGPQSRNPRTVEDALLSQLRGAQLSTPGRGDELSGAAAAAGVLTAIDEDGEGDEEAQPPHDFDYYTEGEDDE